MFRAKARNDESLVRGTIRGARSDFEALVERYLGMAHAIAFAQTGNHSDAEEIAQDTFVQAFTQLGSLRDPARFGQWLGAIARNKGKMLQRTRARENAALLSSRKHVQDFSLASDGAQEEVFAMLRDRVMQLEEGPREMLLMYYFSERSLAEISTTLGISKDAAKKRLERARHALADDLAESIGEVLAPKRGKNDRLKQVLGAVAGLPLPMKSAAAGAGAAAAVGGKLFANQAWLSAFIGLGLVAATITAVFFARHESDPAADSEPSPARVAYAESNTETSDPPQAANQPTPAVAAVPETISIPEPTPAVAAALVPAGPAIRGRVIDVETAAPIPNVQIVAVRAGERDPAYETYTDDAGTYKISEIGPGEYQVSRGLTPDGYCQPNLGDAPVPVAIADGQGSDNIDFTARKEATLSGRIVDASGNSIAGASIAVCGGIGIHQCANGMSGDDGAFTFHGLAPTDDMWIQGLKESLVGVHAFTLPIGGLPDLTLVLQEGAWISGMVTDSANIPLQGVEVYPNDFCRTGWDAASTDDAGRFTCGPLAEGEYLINLRATEATSYRDSGVRVDLAVAERRDGLLLVYEEGNASIFGHVFDSAGSPIPGATITCLPCDGCVTLVATSDKVGYYELTDLPAHRHSIEVSAPGFAACSAENVPPDSVSVDFTLYPDDLEISGHVVDAASGQPLGTFSILTTPYHVATPAFTDAFEHYTRKDFRDVCGRFQTNVPATVWAKSLLVAATAPGYRSAIEILDTRAPRQLSFRLQAGGTFAGRVVDELGHGVAGASVYYERTLPGVGRESLCQSADDGSFHIDNFPQHAQQIAVHDPDFAPAWRTIPENWDASTSYDIVLTQGGEVEAILKSDVPEKQFTVGLETTGYQEYQSVSRGKTIHFQHVPPGEWILRFSAKSEGEHWRRETIEQRVLVRQNEKTTAVHRFEDDPAVLEGIVAIGDELPSRILLEVLTSTPQGERSDAIIADATGEYRMTGLPAGPATVEATITRQNGAELTDTADVVLVDGEATHLDFDFAE